jgi:hypothetical protein
MRTKLIALTSIALCLLVLGALAHAQDQPAKIAGNWEMSMDAPEGSFTLALSIEQNGSKINGKMNSDQIGESAIEGTINGNDLAFGSTLDTPRGKLDAMFKGTVSGDSIKGSATIGDFSLDWTAKRAK